LILLDLYGNDAGIESGIAGKNQEIAKLVQQAVENIDIMKIRSDICPAWKSVGNEMKN